ncbi:serine/threonine-protein kinase [Mumia zhuanghuii]|uniref:non-specific serine/threonine protein kinase n=1 Tax=Mumia zhuanghuii TaxID=2585211 RepID=A0A5C4LW54_9ACTN|nr:serine/threonine-protein kinase [Mumia zhuanghuii]TNC23672.1 serine/threonine protein kinase [Mumia zhuanghuii]TNC28411.1 serine/threonine protein kinase [Mumia zhuanghuii]
MTTPLTSWRLAPGDPLADELIAMRLLGGGTAYEAYLAFDEILHAPVVVKVVRPDLVDDPATLRGLEREAQMLADLAHPAIVRRFGVQLDGPRPHLILENLDGPRLSTLVREHGALPVQQLLPLALELASALHYLRVRDVVHLDVKPSNVIMGAPARLIDLSIARRTEAAAALEDVVGTDDYLAPEQADPQGYGVPSPASDVWGLGATLYHAACGYAPYEPGREGDALEVRYPQLTDRPRTMPYFVEVEVAELVYRCMAPDPGDRPTPREVAQAVEPLMEAMPRARLSGFRISASA